MFGSKHLIDEVGDNYIQVIEDVIGHNVSGVRSGERLYFTGAEALAVLATGAAATFFNGLLSKLGGHFGDELGKSLSERTTSILSMVRERCTQTLKKMGASENNSTHSNSCDNDLLIIKMEISTLPSLLSKLTPSERARISGALTNELTIYFIDCGFTTLKGGELAAQVVKRILNEPNIISTS